MKLPRGWGRRKEGEITMRKSPGNPNFYKMDRGRDGGRDEHLEGDKSLREGSRDGTQKRQALIMSEGHMGKKAREAASRVLCCLAWPYPLQGEWLQASRKQLRMNAKRTGSHWGKTSLVSICLENLMTKGQEPRKKGSELVSITAVD